MSRLRMEGRELNKFRHMETYFLGHMVQKARFPCVALQGAILSGVPQKDAQPKPRVKQTHREN